MVFGGDVNVDINDGKCYYRTDSWFSNIPDGRVKSLEIFALGT